MTPNVKAFLDTIAWSEGTIHFGDNNGYDVIVGGHLFNSYAHHPHVLVRLPKLGISSSAAGRYQFIWPTWLALKDKLHLPNFSPASQDLAAIELLRECGALKLVEASNFAGAVQAAHKIWASLPGAGYGQHEQTLAGLQIAYTKAGGVLA